MPPAIRLLRIHQWVKNLLVLLPAILAHRLADFELLRQAGLAFLSFSLIASSVYVLNDILDREADLKHHSKRNRPLASGAVSLRSAFLMTLLLLVAGIAVALLLPTTFLGLLGVYYVTTTMYSLVLKKIIIADIVILASLYALRILAGGEATGIYVSQWMLVFSMFFFLSLACVKRYSELLAVNELGSESSARRGYQASDLEQISQFGSASGYISVLVLAQYVSSREVSALYGHPQVIWLACPLFLYWIGRVWLLAHRGKVHEDPIIFALTDRVSYLVGALALLVMVCAL